MIPKRFQIAGLTIEVVRDPKLIEKDNCIGRMEHSKQILRIASAGASRQFLEQAYCHEVVHQILHVMGERELNRNEQFVDLFAHLLHQVLSTSEKECRCKLPDSREMKVPDEIVEAALQVERYFKEQNIKGWKLAGCADRSQLP